MSAYGSLILALLAPTASAFVIPIFNPPNLNASDFEEPYRGAPQGRGTVGILVNCLLTFSLCIWTSIHPNILPRSDHLRSDPVKSEDSSSQPAIPAIADTAGRLKFKYVWMWMAMLAPELVMMCSFGERRRASEAAAAWKLKFKNSKLGLGGGFFVEMGGFTARDDRGKLFILTTNGFIKYIKSGRITEDIIDLQQIKDKANSSNFTNLITFLQAVWFIYLCAVRWYKGLPITLLERHVTIQVLFTLMTCIFWWHKPLDVDCPIHLTLLDPPPPSDEIPLPTDDDFNETNRATGSQTSDESVHYVPTRNFVYENCRLRTYSLGVRTLYDSIKYTTTGRKWDLVWICVLLLCNGLWHLFSWDAHFPTRIEATLWGLACLVMCFSVSIHSGLAMLERFQSLFIIALWEERFLNDSYLTCHVRTVKALLQGFPLWTNIVSVFLHIFPLSYAFSVIFILVESLISMRKLARGSFDTATLF